MTSQRPSAAIQFAPNAFQIDQPQLVGRQVASMGLLRAAVAASQDAPVIGYGMPHHGQAFADTVRAINPKADVRWLTSEQPERLNAAGVCYRPDPRISQDARIRLRAGAAHYSICGVFHTTVHAMGEIASTLRDPLMAWDAIVCPSQSVRETVRRVQDAEVDYLRWRFGPDIRIDGPQFPVIPLGVHSADFVFSDAERAAARAKMGLGTDDVVFLFVGRLSLTVKAHPLAMYMALDAAAGRTGKRVCLIECGYFAHPSLEAVYAKAAEQMAPRVRNIFVDGRVPAQRNECWAAADAFVSLSDNIQETFGLTPVEAMAAGLPVVVTDWNGYRETVRDRVDGFRVATRAPAAGMGEHLARVRDAESLSTDLLCWAAAAATSLDQAELVERFCALIDSSDLRRQMGASGQARARTEFDWSRVYQQYQELWAALSERRVAARTSAADEGRLASAPKLTGVQLDPFTAFGHYPTREVTPATMAALTDGSSYELYTTLRSLPLFPMDPAPEKLVAPLWPALERGPVTIGEGATIMGCDARTALMVICALAKMGVVRLT